MVLLAVSLIQEGIYREAHLVRATQVAHQVRLPPVTQVDSQQGLLLDSQRELLVDSHRELLVDSHHRELLVDKQVAHLNCQARVHQPDQPVDRPRFQHNPAQAVHNQGRLLAVNCLIRALQPPAPLLVAQAAVHQLR